MNREEDRAMQTEGRREGMNRVNPVVRALILAIVFIATSCLAYWVPLALIPFESYGLVAPFVAVLCAVAVGLCVWRSLGTGVSAGILPTVLRWAAVVGGIGFAAGFFGPMVFAPAANQGPLLGIFFTGPLGALLGGAAGFLYAVTSRRKNEPPNRGSSDQPEVD